MIFFYQLSININYRKQFLHELAYFPCFVDNNKRTFINAFWPEHISMQTSRAKTESPQVIKFKKFRISGVKLQVDCFSMTVRCSIFLFCMAIKLDLR